MDEGMNEHIKSNGLCSGKEVMLSSGKSICASLKIDSIAPVARLKLFTCFNLPIGVRGVWWSEVVGDLRAWNLMEVTMRNRMLTITLLCGLLCVSTVGVSIHRAFQPIYRLSRAQINQVAQQSRSVLKEVKHLGVSLAVSSYLVGVGLMTSGCGTDPSSSSLGGTIGGCADRHSTYVEQQDTLAANEEALGNRMASFWWEEGNKWWGGGGDSYLLGR